MHFCRVSALHLLQCHKFCKSFPCVQWTINMLHWAHSFWTRDVCVRFCDLLLDTCLAYKPSVQHDRGPICQACPLVRGLCPFTPHFAFPIKGISYIPFVWFLQPPCYYWCGDPNQRVTTMVAQFLCPHQKEEISNFHPPLPPLGPATKIPLNLIHARLEDGLRNKDGPGVDLLFL